MITGAQIRQARRLKHWSVAEIAQRTKLRRATVERALATDGDIEMTMAHEAAFRRAFAVVGIELVDEGPDGPGVRLNKGHPG